MSPVISQFDLLRDKRFAPLFIVQFFGAFNDNLMKAVLVVLVAYGVWEVDGVDPAVLVSLAAALFILPFLLFCPLAGELASRYDKSAMIVLTKLAEIFIVLGAIAVFYFETIRPAFFVLFLLGAQSAFFTPCKFAILPQLLKKKELIAGNALVSTGTYVAILSGTILGTVLALRAGGIEAASVILLLCSMVGFASSFLIAPTPGNKKINVKIWQAAFNPFARMWQSMMFARSVNKHVFWGVLGIAWFYFMGALVHAQLPNFARQTLGVNSDVLTLFMSVFLLGIAIGGLLNNKILKSKVSAKFSPVAATGIALFSVDLYVSAGAFTPLDRLLDIPAFWNTPDSERILFDLAAMAICAGLYVVPLRAMVQAHSPAREVTRIIAASGVMDAVFILLSALAGAALLAAGFSVVQLFLSAGLATLLLAFCAVSFKWLH